MNLLKISLVKTLQGAVSTLKEVNRDWKELDIKLKR